MQGPGAGKGSALRCCRDSSRGAAGKESWRVPIAGAMACLGYCTPQPTKRMWPGWKSPSEKDLCCLQPVCVQHPSCHWVRRKGWGDAATPSVN